MREQLRDQELSLVRLLLLVLVALGVWADSWWTWWFVGPEALRETSSELLRLHPQGSRRWKRELSFAHRLNIVRLVTLLHLLE